jgi:hypothetical protein
MISGLFKRRSTRISFYLTCHPFSCMNMKTEDVLPLGRYVPVQPAPKLEPKGNMIGFNSVNTGETHLYIIKLSQSKINTLL